MDHDPPRLGTTELLTVREVADHLRVSPSTVRRLVRRGALRAHAAGGTYRITPAALDDMLSGAAPPPRRRPPGPETDR